MTNSSEPTPAASSAQLSIPIGSEKWTQVLPVLLAAIESGTPAGARMAKDHLAQMAAAADHAGVLADALMNAVRRGAVLGEDVVRAIGTIKGSDDGRGH